MAFADYRNIVDWEKFQALLAEAVFNGYARGLNDYRNGAISMKSIEEETSSMNEILKEHYYE